MTRHYAHAPGAREELGAGHAGDGAARPTASASAPRGHDVLLHARSAEGAATTEGVGTGVVVGDLARPDQVEALAAQLSAHGAWDAVVHNAGIHLAHPPRPARDPERQDRLLRALAATTGVRLD